MAHEVAEGESLGAFTTVHAQALAERLDRVVVVIDDPRLGRIATRVDAALEELARAPDDRRRALLLERRLARAGEAAGQLAR